MVSSSQLTINRSQGQNQCYKERLAEGCRPLEMMLIPAGSFLMGSPEDELERFDREGPQHQVTLSQFFMARYPVTQAQWRVVVAMPQVKRELKPDPSNFKGDDRPVEQVSWYDAVEFCDRLTLHTNRQYRLPTEAEWEYACRAGTTTPFHFGETITTELANYQGTDNEELGWSGSYGAGPKGEYRQESSLVDAFDYAIAYGLYDLHGNVLDWCADHYGDYKQTPSDGSAFVTDEEGARRILRGGSWVSYPRDCRSAYRDDSSPDNALDYIGFRVSCSAPRT